MGDTEKKEGVEEWRIEIHDGKYAFYRYKNGKAKEAYNPVGRDKAMVYASCIINRYQPPRCLLDLDKRDDGPI